MHEKDATQDLQDAQQRLDEINQWFEQEPILEAHRRPQGLQARPRSRNGADKSQRLNQEIKQRGGAVNPDHWVLKSRI
jgi:hypothetical protein